MTDFQELLPLMILTLKILDNGSTEPTVGLLSSGRDAFANVAAFELGAYWFRPRGVDNRFEDIFSHMVFLCLKMMTEK